MATMKAAVLEAPGRFTVTEVPVPAIGPDDALIRVRRVGICGTDMHIFKGHYAADQLPLIPGHEFAGEIAALGASVTGLTIGQRVVADINIGCNRCYFCRRNEILNCAEVRQVGISRQGAFAHYVAVPARLVIPAPQDAPYELLALTEPVSCVVRAARKARARFGQSVVILGAGPIGNLHVQMMRLLGLAPIIVVEPSAVRAEMACAVGADIAVTDISATRAIVLENTDGRGADLVIESVGHEKLYEQALGLIRPGGHIAAFGITGPEARLPLPILDTVLKEYSIKGSVAGMGEDMHDALTLLRYGRFQTEAFTSHHHPLDEIQTAFETLASRPEALKVQIVLD